MRINVAVECKVEPTFRVKQVAGLFDLPVAKKTAREWDVELPDLSEPWQIGAIVGPSGAGKTMIARKAYGKQLLESSAWPKDRSILDGFPDEISIRDVTGMLSSVGFSSPPDWVKPYAVLSNGQRFRADLARALLTPAKVVAFDEFSSVVDRQVAQFGSAAVSRSIRKGRTADFAQRFVAVTCHYDVLGWLEPDWVLDLGAPAGSQLARRWLQRDGRVFARIGPRPRIELVVRRVQHAWWSLFRPHHYLSDSLNRNAKVFVAFWLGRAVALAAVMPNYSVGRYRMTRVVTLPDYQGLGIGAALTNEVARQMHRAGKIVSLRTSHPAFIAQMRRSPLWKASNLSLCGTKGSGRALGKRTSSGRSTVTFRFSPGEATAPASGDT